MKRAVACALLLLTASCARDFVVWRGRTPDRARDVRVVERGGAQRVVVAGVDREPHHAIGIEGIAMAGEHLAYPVLDGGRWSIVRDGVPSATTWDAIGEVAFDATGAHLAYAGARGSSWRVVVDGNEGTELTGVQRGTLGFDRAGAVVYVGWRGDEARVTHGASVGPAWDGVHDLRIDDDVAYVARQGAKERVVRGTDVSPAYDVVDELADGGWIARAGDVTAVVVGGKTVLESPLEGGLHHLAIGGGHWSVARRTERGEEVVRDGVAVVPMWDKVESIVTSSDGAHSGWIARRSGRAVVVVDGEERGAWLGARALRIGKAGDYAYVGSMGGGAVVVTDHDRAAFDVVIEDSLVVSADGRHWAAIVGYASVRRTYVAVDGRPRARFDLGEWVDAGAQIAGAHAEARNAQLRRWVAAELGRTPGASGGRP